MKIAESAIQLTSSHTANQYQERQESLTIWKNGKEAKRAEHKNGKEHALKHQAEQLAQEAAKVSLSQEAQQRVAEVPEASEAAVPGEEDELMSDLNMRILKALFERLTGRHFRMLDASASQQAPPSEETATTPAEQSAGNQKGWGLLYEHREVYHESETTQFTAQGAVTTADGQQIEIGIEMNMSRSFTSLVEESLQAGEVILKDPLVVNFDGSAAQLTQETFSFDIDADGSDDQIAFVGPRSGLLALDTNSDGVINDGSELFGAQSGDGFADLASYDGDQNGWIDENDTIFSQLRIWMKTASGENQLFALAEKGVGAIYLGRVDTPFSIKDTENAQQGQVRATGLFLHEDGRVGTMQQLDLVA
jgi:hypothetical protein